MCRARARGRGGARLRRGAGAQGGDLEARLACQRLVGIKRSSKIHPQTHHSLTRPTTLALQLDVLVDGYTEDGEIYGRTQWDGEGTAARAVACAALHAAEVPLLLATTRAPVPTCCLTAPAPTPAPCSPRYRSHRLPLAA